MSCWSPRSVPEPFPAGAEERLAAFTDLVATALANAQAHDEVRRFGEEQAALGRVATLVAAGAAPEQVFAAVVEEVSRLLGLERIELVHYDGDVSGTVIASTGDHRSRGSSWSLDDPSVMATVAGRAACESMTTRPDGRDRTRRHGAGGFRSAIGAPITVEGHLWGVISRSRPIRSRFPNGRKPGSASSRSSLRPQLQTPRRVTRSHSSPTSRPRCGAWQRWSHRESSPRRSFQRSARRSVDCSARRSRWSAGSSKKQTALVVVGEWSRRHEEAGCRWDLD